MSIEKFLEFVQNFSWICRHPGVPGFNRRLDDEMLYISVTSVWCECVLVV